ncbi:MAG TPA: RDD family protein, partial [Steroidobacteraceae bacterium]|nr:RDD family protein [Steroidobacteraceae bacterium]
ATRGRTPGKRMAGVELVARDGGAPGVGPLLTRNVFRLIDSLPLFYAVGLTTTMMTRDHLRVGDLAAGTLLVYVRSNAMLPAYLVGRPAASALDARSAEIVTELLERWPGLDTAARHRLAKALLPPSESTEAEDDAVLRMRLEKLAAGTSL